MKAAKERNLTKQLEERRETEQVLGFLETLTTQERHDFLIMLEGMRFALTMNNRQIV